MMHEHDQEIVMALAEGALSPEAAAAAAAEIATCDECSRDLELQRISLEALAQAPAVYMSAAESARLHDALRQELSIAAPNAARPQPRAAWGRLAGWAFGAAAVFLGAVLLLPALSGGGDDASTAETIAAAAAATTTAAFEPSPAAPLEASGGADDEAEMMVGDAVAEDGALSETTASPSMAITPSAGAALRLEIFAEGDLSEEIRSEVVSELASNSAAFRANDLAAKDLYPAIAACLTETLAPGYSDSFSPLPGSDPQLVGRIQGDDGLARLLVAYVSFDLADTTIAAVALDGCDVFQSLP